MDADGSTVDDLFASAKPKPPPVVDEPEDEDEPYEAEPIGLGRLAVYIGPPLALAVTFGLWLVAWWLPLLVALLGLLGFAAWRGKLKGLMGRSSSPSGGGKAGWPLGRPRGSTGLLGGSTGRSGGRAAGVLNRMGLGGRASKATGTGSTPRQSLGQRAKAATKRAATAARAAAQRATTKAREKASAVVHRATGGRLGKAKGSTASSTAAAGGGKGGGKGKGKGGGKGGGGTSPSGTSGSGATDASGKGKGRKFAPVQALKNLVKKATKRDGDTDEPPEEDRPRLRRKKPKKTKDHDDEWDTADDTDDDDTEAETGERPGLLVRAWVATAVKVGDQVRKVDPKKVKEALLTPFEGMWGIPKCDHHEPPPGETPEPAPEPPPAPEPVVIEIPEPAPVPTPRRPASRGRKRAAEPPVAPSSPRDEIPISDDWNWNRPKAPASPSTTAQKGTPVTSTIDTQSSTPGSRAAHWTSIAEARESSATWFTGKAQEFQETLDGLKADENQSTDTEEAIRKATEALAEAEAQASAYDAQARTYREKAAAELATKTN